jgi:hypothetical protein
VFWHHLLRLAASNERLVRSGRAICSDNHEGVDGNSGALFGVVVAVVLGLVILLGALAVGFTGV